MRTVCLTLCAALLVTLTLWWRMASNQQTSKVAGTSAVLNSESADVTLMSMPDVVRPKRMKSGSQAMQRTGFPDEQQIVGVTVGEVSIAYSLESLARLEGHIVNDLVEETPLTVTYCGISDCVRVLTGNESGSPLDLSVAGLAGDKMLVQFGSQAFEQDSKNLPLTDVSFQRMSWGEWRTLHPDSELYVHVFSLAERSF